MIHRSRVEASDEELVARVQGGDADAFALIFERHQGRIAGFLRRIGLPDADVEDLLGETFCRALEKIDQFDVGRERRYLSYLYAIARNLATDRHRQSARLVSLEELEGGREPSDEKREDAVVDEIYQLEQVSLIRQAMERMSPSDREILALAFDRELSSREIMGITGKPSISAVTTHVYKAMKKLRGLVMKSSPEARVS